MFALRTDVNVMYKARRGSESPLVVFGEGQTFLFPSGCHELKLLKFGVKKSRCRLYPGASEAHKKWGGHFR